ncbi:trypsin-like peptidase domain-containing protein [Muricauda sp. 2012CJ35-5]|uniref:Trypsin-like peptidase domain-containing protein n=1 Tax=Flagellimonas spongiicola TaxID=2942208 RepID=A0ABT0PNC3_9FLAO|nr:trypsin-like peptidase domain-containing protein [Allomuricauda spongiicola]MCL6272892.1 trypsin-like peptidase domain-containing protein [Allomuricauda spongiicola]
MKRLVSLSIILFCLIGHTQNLAQLYKKVSSAVVVINVESVAPDGEGSSFQMALAASQGSGVLVNSEGLIWTAAHVIQSAESITVDFLDGDSYPAEVIASNPMSDVAIIKVSGTFELKEKKIATIGDSDKVEIGEDIFVIGAPHGFKQSLSRGILSGRYIPDKLSNDFEQIEFLQTDAAINPGNSGGPLYNMKGEVIGIASSIYTTSGGFDGIGFVAPSNSVKNLMDSSNGPWTGMETLLLNEELTRILNVPQKSGLLVISISSKGSAGKLGLRGGYIPAVINGNQLLLGGDIIMEVAGIKFEDKNSRSLIKQKLASYKTGDLIPIVILRNGQIGAAQFQKQ